MAGHVHARSWRGHSVPLLLEDREQILTLFEKVTGQRMTTSYMVAAACAAMFRPISVTDAVALVKRLRARLPEYWTLIMDNEIFLRRTRGVGIMTAEDCRAFGVTGPCPRAAECPSICARMNPIAPEIPPIGLAVPVETAGDCLARSDRPHVRNRRVAEHGRAIRRPATGRSYPCEDPAQFEVAEGEYYSATEGPARPAGWYLVGDGSMAPSA